MYLTFDDLIAGNLIFEFKFLSLLRSSPGVCIEGLGTLLKEIDDRFQKKRLNYVVIIP